MRTRARSGGLDALPDYELLELYLFRSIPLRDVKPLAKALIARFDGFAGVMAASLEELRTAWGGYGVSNSYVEDDARAKADPTPRTPRGG